MHTGFRRRFVPLAVIAFLGECLRTGFSVATECGSRSILSNCEAGQELA
jgi:hypothetical protein